MNFDEKEGIKKSEENPVQYDINESDRDGEEIEEQDEITKDETDKEINLIAEKNEEKEINTEKKQLEEKKSVNVIENHDLSSDSKTENLNETELHEIPTVFADTNEEDATTEIDENKIDEDELNEDEEEDDQEFTYEYPENAFIISDPENPKKYEKPRTDYPLFHQQYNTCGLSSMTMLLDPPSNPKLQELLDFIWNNMKELMLQNKLEKKEFTWQHALEYLLLKIFHENMLSEYFMDHKEFADDYYICKVPLEVHLRQLQEPHYYSNRTLVSNEYEQYFNNGRVTHFIIKEQISQMKDAKEVEMLFSLFGYDFFAQYSPDGTGAIFFTNKELKHPEKPSVKRRLELLKHEFDKGARIMCGMFHHWVAVRNIIQTKRGYSMIINDPNTARQYKIPFRKLSDTDRFYIFKKREESPEQFWEKLKSWLEEEFKLDKEAFANFKQTLQKQMQERMKQQHAAINAQTIKTAPTHSKIPTKNGYNPEEKELVQIPGLKKIKPTTPPEITEIPNANAAEEISDLSSKRAIRQEQGEPLSGNAFMDYIRKIIRSNFSDYSKL